MRGARRGRRLCGRRGMSCRRPAGPVRCRAGTGRRRRRVGWRVVASTASATGRPAISGPRCGAGRVRVGAGGRHRRADALPRPEPTIDPIWRPGPGRCGPGPVARRAGVRSQPPDEGLGAGAVRTGARGEQARGGQQAGHGEATAGQLHDRSMAGAESPAASCARLDPLHCRRQWSTMGPRRRWSPLGRAVGGRSWAPPWVVATGSRRAWSHWVPPGSRYWAAPRAITTGPSRRR